MNAFSSRLLIYRSYYSCLPGLIPGAAWQGAATLSLLLAGTHIYGPWGRFSADSEDTHRRGFDI